MKAITRTPCAAGGLRALGAFLAAIASSPAVEVFTDAACTQPGLNGNYVNSALTAVKADDWRAAPGIAIAGTRVDTGLAFTTDGWGARGEVGVTGGSDADWDQFSVQWDGYLRVTDDGQRVATASDDGSRMWIDADRDGRFGDDELLDNGWGRGQGVTIGSRSRPLAAGVYPVRIQYCELGGGNEFHLLDSPWIPVPFVETPGNPRQTVRVLVLNFEPRVPSEGNRRMWEVFGWPDPRTLASQFAADLEFITGGALRVEIVDWRDVDGFPVFGDGFRYDPDAYVANRRANSGWHTGAANFDDLLQRHNLLAAVNDDRIDEIWCFGDHYFALFGEAWMAGPNPFFINGPSFPEAGFDRAVAGYGFNYERGVAEMLHNLAHRTENHGQRAFGGWNLGNPQTAFDRFSANFLESSGHTAGVGTCHVPANAGGHYDYGNERVVESTAFDWANFPDLAGETTEVGRDTWGMGPAPDHHRDYMNFYFGMMPRNAGTDGAGRQANWFKYIWDFNSYEEGSGRPRGGDAFASGPRVRAAGATACRFTVRYYDETGVDPDTLGNDDASVLGPDWFEAAATLVGIGPPETTTAGAARTVTYEITPPGGAWDAADNGTYRIRLHEDQVLDREANAFPAGEIGSFQVVIDNPATLDVAGMLAAGGVTATHTPFDIGAIGNLFDGSVSTLVRTPAINPMTVTLEFSEPQPLHGARAWFTATWGDPAYRWQMEMADTLADLDQRTGSWRQAVPLTGTPSDSFSAATLDPPVTARLVRLTAQRLTGDDYVHACEWQLVGPPVTDTAPPAAAATSAPVTTPGATAQFITVDLTDATRVATASLDTGNLIVRGPGGLVIEPVFHGVDNHLSGSPRVATYWFIPPGGNWDSADNGTYTIALQRGQIRDTVGNTHAAAQDIGSFTVGVPAPVRRPACDLSEGNAALWEAAADDGAAAVSDDTGRKTTGQAAVRFETDGGFDTWLRFPPAQAADWDLTAATTLAFSVYAENPNPGFQENSPWIKLLCPDGSCFEYRYYLDGNRADLLNDARDQWLAVEVPLRAGDAVTNGWRRTAHGAPDLAHVSGIEIHADTWGSGFTLWFDGLGFDVPVDVTAVTLELAPGGSHLSIVFDADVEDSLEVTDIELTHSDPATPVAPDAMALSYQSGSHTAVVTFPGLPGGLLASGACRLVLAAGSVADPCGHALAADFIREFRVLDGDADEDHDGMADTWERDHGLDSSDPADAGGDADGDRQTNAGEYLARTDPRNPASRLAVAALVRDGDELWLEWFSVPGRRYRIWWSEDLLGWATLTSGGVEVVVPAAGAGDLTTHWFAIPLTPVPPKCYVRVEVLAP